jgi:hypothetical protein
VKYVTYNTTSVIPNYLYISYSNNLDNIVVLSILPLIILLNSYFLLVNILSNKALIFKKIPLGYPIPREHLTIKPISFNPSNPIPKNSILIVTASVYSCTFTNILVMLVMNMLVI